MGRRSVWDAYQRSFHQRKVSYKDIRDYYENKSSRTEAFEVLVWERGVGPTAACGCGACSIGKFILSHMGFSGRWELGQEVAMPGGNLYTEKRSMKKRWLLVCSAAKVFAGSI